MNSFLRGVVALGVSLMCSLAGATEQIPDTIVVDGVKQPLQSNPLDRYLDQHPEIRLQATSSANWRGYIGEWALVDQQLMLNQVYRSSYEEIKTPKKNQDGLREVKTDLTSTIFKGETLPLKAQWYSGTLVVPYGKSKGSMGMGYTQRYDGVLLAQIEQGAIVKQVRMGQEDFEKMRQEQFEAFQQTDLYKNELRKSIENHRKELEIMKKKDPEMAKLLSSSSVKEEEESFAFVAYSFGMDEYIKLP